MRDHQQESGHPDPTPRSPAPEPAPAREPEQDASDQSTPAANPGPPTGPAATPQTKPDRPTAKGPGKKKKKKKNKKSIHKRTNPRHRRGRPGRGRFTANDRLKLSTDTLKVNGVPVDISESESIALHTLCLHILRRLPRESRYLTAHDLLEEFPFRDDVAFIHRLIYRLRERIFTAGICSEIVVTRRGSGYRINTPAKNIKVEGYDENGKPIDDDV